MQVIGGDVQTTRNPLWKSTLWLVGAVLYVIGASGLSAFVAWLLFPFAMQLTRSVSPGLVIALLWLGVTSLWIGLLAFGTRQAKLLGYKGPGCMPAVITGLVVVLSIYIVSWGLTGKWWLGYAGVPDPFAVRYNCDFGSGACTGWIATQTAQAPHPPDWLPWGH